MTLYENNIDFRLLDKVTGGFITALAILHHFVVLPLLLTVLPIATLPFIDHHL